LAQGCAYRWWWFESELRCGEVTAKQDKLQTHLESWGQDFQVVWVVHQREFLFLPPPDD